MNRRVLLQAALLFSFASSRVLGSGGDWKFQFGAGVAPKGWTAVAAGMPYDEKNGYGFVDSAGVREGDGAEGYCIADKPFLFSMKVPEGNYNVTLTLANPNGTSETTVKAQSRELMLEKVKPPKGGAETRGFTVNIRTPNIPGEGSIALDQREIGPPLLRRWEDRLTLEFDGSEPCVSSIEVSKAPGAITLFLAGDSTVTEQPDEPWAGWGQMLPRFFRPGVAIANHAESGLALYSFKAQRRLDKVLSAMRPGDYLFIQFGHNDQKDKTPGSGPFTSYEVNLRDFIAETRKKKGIPVLVTSMERRRWSPDGKPIPTLADYAEAMREVGREEGVPVIDLNAMSLKFYTALGPEGSKKAFAHYPAGTYPGQTKELKDDTHHNNYGGYELGRCVVEGIKSKVPALAVFLRPDAGFFDPSHPDLPEVLRIAPSPPRPSQRPAGS